MPLSFRLTSYNILADAYATRRLYPAIAPDVLSWSRRGPAIVRRIVGLAPDVACLQEVEQRAWPELEAALAAHGYRGVFAAKRRDRPDGCALVYRDGALSFIGSVALHFSDGLDGAEASGHLALIGSFGSSEGLIRIAGTHLKWQASVTPADAHVGYRQARELIDHCLIALEPAHATIICGDLNVAPDRGLIKQFRERGFDDAYAVAAQSTCNPHRRATRIDYIFHTAGLRASPAALPVIDDDTPLPSASEPSDHLPITAELRDRD